MRSARFGYGGQLLRFARPVGPVVGAGTVVFSQGAPGGERIRPSPSPRSRNAVKSTSRSAEQPIVQILLSHNSLHRNDLFRLSLQGRRLLIARTPQRDFAQLLARAFLGGRSASGDVGDWM